MKLLIVHSRSHEYKDLIMTGLRGELPGLEIATAQDKSEVPSSIDDVDVILSWRIPKEIIKKATGLKWLASTGAGVDHLLVPGLPAAVVVTKAPPIFAGAITEYVIGYVLYVSLGMGKILSNMPGRSWTVPEHFRLSGKLVGVLGMGTIGTHVARTAMSFGMRVWGVRRNAHPVDGVEKIFAREELESFLPCLDFLVLTLPLTEETKNLVDKDKISLLKPDCWIINVSRGRIINEDDIAAALVRKKLGGYISDVFASEPLPADSPLWELPNVIITPHYAALTQPGEFVPYFVENLKRFARGENLLFQIDRERGY